MADHLIVSATVETSPSPEELPAHKERQILDGAAMVFARDGYEGASMSRIASEAGVSKGTLYNYFPSKADLFRAYVKRECARSIAKVFDDLDQSAPPVEALSKIGLGTFRLLLSDLQLTMYRVVISEAERFPEHVSTPLGLRMRFPRYLPIYVSRLRRVRFTCRIRTSPPNSFLRLCRRICA